MTRFTVTWDDDAIQELTELWLLTANRNGVAAASNAIDRELAVDANTKGRELSEDLQPFHSPIACDL